MPYRIETYKDAFEVVLGIKYSEKLQRFLKSLEKDGHTEKSICYAIWKTQEKLLAFKNDPRFFSILNNEINKWSWRKGDPRWDEYWKRKNEEAKAEEIRKEIDRQTEEEFEMSKMEERAFRYYKGAKGYVYFIQGLCGGAIKIGYSKDPQARLRELQTGYPDTLTILLMIPGTEALESVIHKRFESLRLRGEWFRPDQRLIDDIRRLKTKYKQN